MRKFVGFLVVLLVFGWSSGASAVPIEWTVGTGGNGHFYEAVDLGTAISWDDAKVLAEAAGGYLATITSAEEDAWVSANLLPLITGTGGSAQLGPFIGGYQDTSAPSFSEPSGGWAWITGETWSYTGWALGEPNDSPSILEPENYIHYYVPGTCGSSCVGWNDIAAFDTVTPGLVDSYIIEVVPEPSTALLLGIGLTTLAATRRHSS